MHGVLGHFIALRKKEIGQRTASKNDMTVLLELGPQQY